MSRTYMGFSKLLVEQSIEYLKTQSVSGGFPPWEGAVPNAITTAEVISALYSVDHPWKRSLLPKASSLLTKWQKTDGSWTDPNSSDPWDVSSTAWAVRALMKTDAHKSLRSCVRGTQWLCKNILPEGGLPTNANQNLVNTYATAYSFSVLRAFGKETESESCLRFLTGSQNKDGGWGLYAREPSESTLTAYVLHGLLDGGIPAESEVASKGIAFLRAKQAQDGTWGSWLNETKSVEGTAFSLFILCKAEQIQSINISESVRFLKTRFADGSAWILQGVNQVWIAVSTLLVGNALARYYGSNGSIDSSS